MATRPTRRFAYAVVLSLLAWGCDDEPAVRRPDQPSLVATVIQYRPDEGTRRISVEVTNTDEAPVRVTAVQLRTPAFASVPATDKNATFAVGQTIALATQYGDPRCGTAAEAGVSEAAAVLSVAGTGATTTVEVPVAASGLALLRRLHHAECQQAALDKVADVRLLSRWRRVEVDGVPYLRGTLLLERRPGDSTREPVTVRSLIGSVLLDLRPVHAGRPVATLDADESSERVPVLFGSNLRCDAHALGGSTTTFLLSAFVRRGDAAGQRVLLIPERAARRQVLDVVADACDGAGG